MQHKTIIATCAAMAAFSGMATADIQLPLDVLNANNGGKTFSAQLGAGYATKYISRGLAFQNSASDHVIPLEAVGAYQLNNQYSLIGGLKYQWLTDNGLEHNDSGICDEGSAILGVSRKFGNPLSRSELPVCSWRYPRKFQHPQYRQQLRLPCFQPQQAGRTQLRSGHSP